MQVPWIESDLKCSVCMSTREAFWPPAATPSKPFLIIYHLPAATLPFVFYSFHHTNTWIYIVFAAIVVCKSKLVYFVVYLYLLDPFQSLNTLRIVFMFVVIRCAKFCHIVHVHPFLCFRIALLLLMSLPYVCFHPVLVFQMDECKLFCRPTGKNLKKQFKCFKEQ